MHHNRTYYNTKHNYLGIFHIQVNEGNMYQDITKGMSKNANNNPLSI